MRMVFICFDPCQQARKIGPPSDSQRNAIRIGMAFHWWADSDPTLVVDSAYVTVPFNNFQSCRDWVELVLSSRLAQGHNTVPLSALSL